jgi:hypothetical protein
MNYVLPNLFPSNKGAHQLARNFLFVTVINTVIAAFITYVVPTYLSFAGNLVFSYCIGYLMWLLLDGGRLLLWGAKRPPTTPFFSMCLICVPFARIVGGMMASRILGVPDQSLDNALAHGPVRFVAMTISISLFIIWIFWNRSRVVELTAEAAKEKARVAAIEKQAIQAQLQLLQAQIEPHMLFNTLANLQGLIALDAPRAQHMLEQLIVYLRATLTSARAEKTTLAHEFALMDAYLELMSIRMGSRLAYTLQLPDELRSTSIPPMLLQPLVENAINHGIEPKLEGGSITVVANKNESTLHISVADTGTGLQPSGSSSTKGTNVGLANVRERLQALYGDKASFSLTANAPCGALAQLHIPLS